MSGRHAAAVDVDDQAIAENQPAQPGAHRADAPAADDQPNPAPAPKTRTGRRAAQRKDPQ